MKGRREIILYLRYSNPRKQNKCSKCKQVHQQEIVIVNVLPILVPFINNLLTYLLGWEDPSK